MLVNNMNFKIALLITLVIMIMLIALGVVKQYRERHNLFLELSMFLNEYELNIGFKKDKLKAIISNFNAGSNTKTILNSYLDNFNNTDNLKLDNIKILQTDEQSYLVSMFGKLGRSNYENEKLQLGYFKAWISEKLNEAKDKTTKLCPLIIKLSLLFALGLAVIFI